MNFSHVSKYFQNFYFTVSTLIHHLRVKHLSVATEIPSDSDYHKTVEDFGDHIIEYESEESDNIIKIHSVL